MLYRSIVVRAIQGVAAASWLGLSLSAATLEHRYSFTADASDSVGAAAGTLLGGATIAGGGVVLDGSSGYVDLPNGILTNLTSATFEIWLTDNGSGSWSRIFDFGNSTAGEGAAGSGTQYIFLTPQSGSGTLRGGITVGSGEQLVEWAGTRLPTGVQKHVVWTIDAVTQTGRLYVDGVLVGENLAVSLTPAALGVTVNNWIGRSQFSADAYLKASVSEFRIYNGALTAAEVTDNFGWGPDIAAQAGPVQFLVPPQSQSTVELGAASFTVKFTGTPPVGIQWRRNGGNIAGATNSIYTIASAALTDHNAAYSVVLTNSYLGTPYSITSTNAILSVAADLTPPTLGSAASVYPTEVRVTFSEGVSDVTGTNAANYAITRVGGSLAVSAARFGSSSAEIILTTATQTLGTNYTLTVNNVRDRAAAANLIAANSQTGFIATLFQSANIGNPAIAGLQTPVVNGVDVTAAGTGIFGAADQFTFSYQNFTNNFDVRVRVAGVSLAGTWTRAALMARDGLASNAVFAASVATPGALGCHFESRAAVGGSTAMAGTYPVNYPDTWLRLRRAGSVFDAFASLDGSAWEYLGTATLTMSNVVQVGFALTAASVTTTTTAQFRDFAAAAGTITTNAPLPFEPLGPSSRRTALVISEIMYSPPAAWLGGGDLEFVEIWNSGLITEDLTGHKLTGEIDYEFPANTKIAPGQFLVIAKDPVSAQSFYGGAFLGPYTGKLANSGGMLRLKNELGGILLEINYDNQAPWPVAADGAGHSLVLNRPSYGENDARAWSASDVMGGSPGAFEHYGTEPARAVVVNEILAHTDAPQVDYVELFNPGAQAVNLSGAWLSDTAGTNKYQIVNGTTIPARGFLAFSQAQLGFAFAADGEAVYLVNSNQTRVLDAVKFDGQENGVSLGRYPNGAPGFQRLATVTQGTSNTPPQLSSVVISEIMYHPISENDDDEYLELYNRSGSAVNLGGWQLQDGVSFTFPSNTIIAAGGYVVVAESLTNLLAKYSQLNSTNAFGNYSGKLSNSGERIVLAKPDDLVSTNVSGVVTTNIFYIPVNEVTYGEGGRWGKWSDGGGSSLELIDPDADTRLAPNWADSDEGAKATWTTIDATNIMENGQTGLVNEGTTTYGVANRFELFLQGEGEALVDNLEFLSNGGANLIANGDFASDTNNWVISGVLRKSVRAKQRRHRRQRGVASGVLRPGRHRGEQDCARLVRHGGDRRAEHRDDARPGPLVKG
ncbi:MAG: lamin tail domain-containing protein [Verrucomicrobiota bacterium]